MNIKNNDRADYISEELAKRKKNGTDDDKGINAEMESIRMHDEAFSRIKEVTGVFCETGHRLVLGEAFSRIKEVIGVFCETGHRLVFR